MALKICAVNRWHFSIWWIMVAGLFLGGCPEDMAEQPSFSHQEAPRRHSPPKSIPHLTPFSLATSPPGQTEKPTDGAELFAINCAHCHGPQGIGDGPVAGYLPELPSNLHAPALQQKSDAMLYGIVTEGLTVMPAFKRILSPEERWALVSFLRSLSDHTPSSKPVIQESKQSG